MGVAMFAELELAIAANLVKLFIARDLVRKLLEINHEHLLLEYVYFHHISYLYVYRAGHYMSLLVELVLGCLQLKRLKQSSVAK